ncbi:MAG: PfkB family carbohydrate kinase, partial [Thermodesulfobacteriota bacterium]|nr:PfkB family carbohydrate kinase [Thermodesulfobacteriota bacterium]
MILVIGEILFDWFPEYRRIGGAPFNFAYHLKNVGMPVRFMTRIGNDSDGKEILLKLKQLGFIMDDIQVDDRYDTGKVMVSLDRHGSPQFDIRSDVAYDHIAFPPAIGAFPVDEIRLVYFGSLIQRTENGFNVIRKILSQRNR